MDPRHLPRRSCNRYVSEMNTRERGMDESTSSRAKGKSVQSRVTSLSPILVLSATPKHTSTNSNNNNNNKKKAPQQ